MSNTTITNPAFKSDIQIVSGFNLVHEVNTFTSVFGKSELEEREASSIEQLVIQYAMPCHVSKSQSIQDVEEMKQLTAEIRSVGKRCLVLIGERVFKVRDILKRYKEGSFTQWLIGTFGCRRTGYNYLTYYEFYKQLPNNELKEGFKKFPQKFAYKLASRKGDIGIKCDIVREYCTFPLEEIYKIIDEMLPLKSEERLKHKVNDDLLISRFLNSLEHLSKRKRLLSNENLAALSQCQALICEILS
jgi:hypothetical protein